MAELGKKLGKLSLAILENFVEKALGQKFVGELRQPTDREAAIESALEKAEDLFYREFKDRTFAEKMFTQVNDDNLGLLVTAIEKYYDHPTNPDLPRALNQIVAESFPDADAGLVKSAVEMYVGILTEEFMIADEKFREKFRGLADVRSLEVLRRVEALLSQRETPKIENTIFRSIHQLSQPLADFTGREELIEQLTSDFISHKGATISGLTGMGGIGKTALGLKVAHKIAENYPEAQIFLDLKGTTTPLSALDIARHVILSFEPTADLRALDETNMQAAYQSVLHGKKALLFFDNARSANQIAPLTPPETCAMIITSRWTFSVPGLQQRRVKVMGEQEAKEFLLELCPRIGESASELAKACAYLPLALRIAGSFLQINNNWSIEKYLSQLNDRKHRLATLKESREDAELTTEPDLLATFELSYNQLSEENQRYWRMLGVFSASFSWNAASRVWALEEIPARKLLSLFLRYSLVEFNKTTTRFVIHDLLGDFALDRLDEKEKIDTRYQYAQCYLNALNTANSLYAKGGDNIIIGLQVLDREWEHINNGHDWAVNNKELDGDVLLLVNSYPLAGHLVFPLRLTPRVHIQWLLHGLSAAERLEKEVDISHHLVNLGNAYSRNGQVQEAIDVYEQQLTIVRKLGYRNSEGITLGNLGIAFAKLGRFEEAADLLEQQLVIMQETGDRRGEGMALGNLGNVYKALGETRKAISCYEKDLAVSQDIGDKHGEMVSLGSLGVVYASLHDYAKAMSLFEQQLIIARELGDKEGEGISLAYLGYAITIMGKPDQGTKMIRDAIKILEEIESLGVQWARERLNELGLMGQGRETE